HVHPGAVRSVRQHRDRLLDPLHPVQRQSRSEPEGHAARLREHARLRGRLSLAHPQHPARLHAAAVAGRPVSRDPGAHLRGGDTPQGLTDATTAIYAGLRGFYGRGETDYTLTELGTDTWTAADQVSSGGAQNWIYYDTYEPTYTSQGSFLDAFWGWGYTEINRANTVLDHGPQVPVGGTLTQAVKDSRLGEAHFLRALAYFELVQQFGGLTINLHAAQGVSTEATRQSEDSVYKVIIDDLNQAINLLPVTQPDYGRATKGAAQNLLAKVYLTRAYR